MAPKNRGHRRTDPLERTAFITAFVSDQTQATPFLHWVAEGNGGLIAVMSIVSSPNCWRRISTRVRWAI